MKDRLTFKEPDWFSDRIPLFAHFLEPLRGRAVELLEIGSYEGRSACWLAENILTHSNAGLMCVDPCDNGAVSDRLRANLVAVADSGYRVELFQGLSAKVLPDLMVEGRRFDFIYVDGSHVAPDVLLDAAMSFALLRPGGILAFDDYDWSPGYLDGTPRAPKLAINSFAAVYAERAECLHRGGQAWFRKLVAVG